MGIKGKDILRGVGAALRGQSTRRREDERVAKADALAERELTLREQESKLRQQQLKFQNIEAQVKISHGQLVRTSMASGYTDEKMGYGSSAMASAITKYVKDGKAYEHKGYVKSGPNKGVPIWRVGTYKTEADGKMSQDPSTGKPIFQPLEEGEGKSEKTWDSIQGYTNFIQSQMNPAYLTAMQVADRTFEQTRREVAQKLKDDVERAKAMAKTPQGAAAIAGTQAKTKRDLAAANLDTEKAKVAGVGANNKVKDMSLKELTARLGKKFGESIIDEPTALKIASLQSNAKNRKIIAEKVAKALDPNDAYTRTRFISDGKERGIPQEVMAKIYDDAAELYEDKVEEVKLGSDSWWKKVWNGLVN